MCLLYHIKQLSHVFVITYKTVIIYKIKTYIKNKFKG